MTLPEAVLGKALDLLEDRDGESMSHLLAMMPSTMRPQWLPSLPRSASTAGIFLE